MRTLFVPNDLFSRNLKSAQLVGDEFHHAVHVLRLKIGSLIRIIDGEGHAFIARIKEIDLKRQKAYLEVLETTWAADPELKVSLITAVPRPARMDFLVEKATEIGVDRIIPVRFNRTERTLSGKTERWRKIAISASKQCGRASIPKIYSTTSLEDALKLVADCELKLAADPDAEPHLIELNLKERAAIVVGPEGGFTDDEKDLLENHNFTFFNLGVRVLRVETAAIVALAVWFAKSKKS